jgi:hypothetical protein
MANGKHYISEVAGDIVPPPEAQELVPVGGGVQSAALLKAVGSGGSGGALPEFVPPCVCA